jgi:lysophospholipid acyltransferase (LPLAT)-like uncharacterized protein
MSNFVHGYILGPLVWFIFKMISLTWRVQLIEPPEVMQIVKARKPCIFAHWHGDDVVLITLLRRYRISTMVSTSKDGTLMNTILRLQGATTTRGSSTRGGMSALKGLVKLIKAGRTCSFAIDAPKGPLHKVKPGVFEMSRLTHSPIFAAGVVADRAWRFEKSWDKTVFPKPFAKVTILWSGPYPATTRDQDPHSPELAAHLEEALHKTHAEAQRLSI